MEFKVKKEGWGGGGTRVVKFQHGQSDQMVIKPGGKGATVTIGPGLSKDSRELQISEIDYEINLNVSFHVWLYRLLNC